MYEARVLFEMSRKFWSGVKIGPAGPKFTEITRKLWSVRGILVRLVRLRSTKVQLLISCQKVPNRADQRQYKESRSIACTSHSIHPSITFLNMATPEEEVERDMQLLEEVYMYLTDKKYPPGCSDTRKRVIRKKAQKFELNNGELFYKQQKKGKVCFDDLHTFSLEYKINVKTNYNYFLDH